MENKGPKILFLYAEVMGYTLSIINSLLKNYNAEIHIVELDEKKLTSFQVPQQRGIYLYKKSELDLNSLTELCLKIDPSIVYVSGWMDKDYIKIAKLLKKKNIPIVCGLDNQWRGTVKQKLATLISRFYIKSAFDYMWVSGIYQYEYARHLGYSKNKIIFGIYTADVEKFNEKYIEYKDFKSKNYPHNILFVGRFTERKGVDILINAYQKTLEIQKHDWTLTLIGAGHLKEQFQKTQGVIIKDFMQPDALVNEIKHAGIFCLPSIYEAWGVVVHEFAAAGLPLITSSECGSSTEFVKSGYNGFTFNTGDASDLGDKLLYLINKTDAEMNMISERSHTLAQHIHPDISAATLIQIIKSYDR